MAIGPCRVLVVDDEPAVCALIGDELLQQGYDCTVATQPEQALGLLDGDGTECDPKIAAAAVQWCRGNPDKLILPGKTAPAIQEVV